MAGLPSLLVVHGALVWFALLPEVAHSLRGLTEATPGPSPLSAKSFDPRLPLVGFAVGVLIWVAAVYQALRGCSGSNASRRSESQSRVERWGPRLQCLPIIAFPVCMAIYVASDHASCSQWKSLNWGDISKMQCDTGPQGDVFNLTAHYSVLEGAREVGALRSGVPKIIHQTGGSRLYGEKHLAWIRSWNKYNPGWIHVFWLDEDIRKFFIEKHPEALELFDSYPYNIMRIDMMRAYVLHTYGGVYVDLDYEALSPLEPHLEDSDLALVESPFKQMEDVQNSFMASRPKHPFWQKVFELLKGRFNEWKAKEGNCMTGNCDVIKMTGPGLLSDALKGFAQNRASQDGIRRLPSKPFMWGQSESGIPSVAVHHYDDSWLLALHRHWTQNAAGIVCAISVVWLACWSSLRYWLEARATCAKGEGAEGQCAVESECAA